MSFVRCLLCNGKKTIVGLGMLEKECPTCYGVGYVDSKPKDSVKDVKKASAKGPVKVEVKRG